MNGIEQLILKNCATALIGAGFQIRIHDGEELVTGKLSDPETVLTKAKEAGVDELTYKVYKKGENKKFGFVFFIFGNGNNGLDVVTDYSTNLEDQMKVVNDHVKWLENGDGN